MATGGTGNIPLHPPSFFEALYGKEEGERSEAIHGVQEELRQLWQENKELKYRADFQTGDGQSDKVYCLSSYVILMFNLQGKILI